MRDGVAPVSFGDASDGRWGTGPHSPIWRSMFSHEEDEGNKEKLDGVLGPDTSTCAADIGEEVSEKAAVGFS